MGPHSDADSQYAAQTLGRVRRDDFESRILTRAFIDDRGYSRLRFSENPLAKVFGERLLWHGVGGSISSSDSYGVPRDFAAAIHSKFQNCDGIAYIKCIAR